MDSFSQQERSQIMSKIKSRGNKLTELAMIRIFRSNKITGWRRRHRLFGNPDFVFPKSRLAIFVDGEFWHGHPNEKVPDSNREFWIKKIERNKKRDELVNRFLQEHGWTVLRFWQSELKNEDMVVRRMRAANGPLRF